MMEEIAQRMSLNPNYDPENSIYDRDSDQDFQIQEAEEEEYGDENSFGSENVNETK